FLQADGGLARKKSPADLLVRQLMKGFDGYLSSGIQTDQYFLHYGVSKDKLLHYRFTSLNESELRSHKELRTHQAELRQKLGYQPDEVICFSAGQQIPRKGYDILAQAAIGLNASCRFVIAGGQPEEKVSAILREHPEVRFEFIGFLSKEQMAEYYAAADLFVLPTRYDIWGLVINEALSFGLPVIGTDQCVAALEFANQYHACKIVPAESVIDLHDALIQFSSDQPLLEEYSRSAFEAISGYSMENSAQDLHKAFKTGVETYHSR
ncbi:MAG: glycosyltransferase family 4 protein, partial [Solobacterium sp.]|nr:glycosyltransferase family 4 protein [Solobacterium sp.]